MAIFAFLVANGDYGRGLRPNWGLRDVQGGSRQIEGAGRFDVRIDHGGRNIRMSEDGLENMQGDTGHGEVGGEGVS